MDMDTDDFTRYFELVDLAVDSWTDIDGLDVRPTLSPHPVETSVFTFRAFWEGHYLTYAHPADIASLDVLTRMVTNDSKQPGLDATGFERVKQFYR